MNHQFNYNYSLVLLFQLYTNALMNTLRITATSFKESVKNAENIEAMTTPYQLLIVYLLIRIKTTPS